MTELLPVINNLIYAGHWLIFAGVALALCATGVLLYRTVNNRLAGFIYRLGK